MILICVDPGTYSLKYLVTRQNKKAIELLDAGEIVLDNHLGDEQDLHALHAKIIDEIRSGYIDQTKICTIVPSEYITSRIIDLPIKNRKKVEMMIPFQLEEDLPYSSSELHFSSDLKVEGSNTKATVAITRREDFERFFNPLKSKGNTPYYLTNQMSLLSDIVNEQQIDSRFCILDFGHTTTQAYFFKDGELVSQHISYVAGKTLTEAIAKSYKIDFIDAVNYKHENAFVLTQSQLEDVNDSQRKFASLMDEVLSSLINDFKRWDLGYRVNHQDPIGHIYLAGGSSHIKNIESYLLEKLSYPIGHLSQEIVSPIDMAESTDQYINCTLLANSFPRRNKLSNFLTGEYTSDDTEDLPIHSLFFNGLRASIICLVIIGALFAERFFINRNLTTYSKKVTNVLKNTALEMTQTDRRQLRRSPERVLAKLKRKRKDMQDQKRALESIQEIDSFSPLIQLSQVAARQGVILDQFSSNEQTEVIAVFKPNENSSTSALETLKTRLESQGLPDLQVNLNRDTQKLTVRYFGGLKR